MYFWIIYVLPLISNLILGIECTDPAPAHPPPRPKYSLIAFLFITVDVQGASRGSEAQEEGGSAKGLSEQ